MAEQRNIGNISRRGFLKIAGAVAGSAAVPSVLYAMGRDVALRQLDLPPLRLGVLLPSSSLNPLLPQSVMAGMRLSLERLLGAAGSRRINLVTEDIGTGQTLAHAAAKKLIEKDRVDLLIGFVNTAVSSSLAPLLRNEQTPFVAANMGEYMKRDHDRDPAIIHSTLQYWQTHWSMGAWAARHIGRTAFIASSLYDSGYDSAYAFQLGFESAGGELAGRSVSGNDQLMKEIKQAGPAFVYALYCGKEAIDFVRAYSASGLSQSVPLAGSGFLTDEDNLRQLGGLASGIRTCFAWSQELELSENMDFTTAYRTAAERPADAFALLGYDTCSMVLSALQKTAGKTDDRDALKKAFNEIAVIGPRGLLRVDPKTGSVAGPLYIREVAIKQGRAVNRPVATVNSVTELDPLMKPMRMAMRTGWHNGYMCV